MGVVASGYAKTVAAASGVDLRTVPGSGPVGRIVAEDVQNAGKASGTSTQNEISSVSSVSSNYQSPLGWNGATPTAKELAKSKGFDIKTVKGTGNFGRVTADDVRIALGIKPEGDKYLIAEEEKAKNEAAKAVAANMEKTLDVPIFRVSRTIVTDQFDELYKKVKAKGVSVSALLAKAVAMTLEKHPIINAAYEPGAIKYNDDINIAMAVALDGGLITPTIRKANTMDIYSVGREWQDLVAKARDGKLKPEEYNSGTFTISNLGMFGVSAFDAILPTGQGSILAIGSSIPTVVALPDGHFGVQKQMTVTITCDHRHIYGGPAAEFLRDLADLMENDVESLLF